MKNGNGLPSWTKSTHEYEEEARISLERLVKLEHIVAEMGASMHALIEAHEERLPREYRQEAATLFRETIRRIEEIKPDA